MRGTTIAIAMLGLALGVTPALACLNDSECSPANKCYFTANETEGLCFGSDQNPTVPSEANRLSTPLHRRGNAGAVCQFSVDCRPLYSCYKRPGTVEGVCLMRGRG